MGKHIDYYFAYIYSKSRDGEVTYLHSAPCLHINRPAFDYWTRIAQGKGVLDLGNGMWAATQDKES